MAMVDYTAGEIHRGPDTCRGLKSRDRGKTMGSMKPIIYSRHALDQLPGRGLSREDVEQTIRTGETIPAKGGRLAFRRNFLFESEWKGRFYAVKQVLAIVAEEPEGLVVVTAYAFYFGART
jgi:hypothetical protein